MSRCRGCNKKIDVTFFVPQDVTATKPLDIVQESLCGTCKSWAFAALYDAPTEQLKVLVFPDEDS